MEEFSITYEFFSEGEATEEEVAWMRKHINDSYFEVGGYKVRPTVVYYDDTTMQIAAGGKDTFQSEFGFDWTCSFSYDGSV